MPYSQTQHIIRTSLLLRRDMSKAHDRVEWDFLQELFVRLGFHSKYIEWIMFCIRSVSYSVLVMPTVTFDLAFPVYFFCVEALVHVMNKAERE